MSENMSQPPSQIYTPLKERQIRVLVVQPGAFDDPLKCSLITRSLEEKPSYDALSYTWGGPGEPKTITLEGIAWEITANLEQALLHLRPSDKELYIWVDAICINQNDNQEKASQVQMMGDVYRFATCVRAWISLAEGTESGELFEEQEWDVWKLLRVFGTSQKFDCWEEKFPFALKEGRAKIEMLSYMEQSWTDKSGIKAWEGITHLLKRPYWRRVWIQQEIYNNREVFVHFGHEFAPIEWWSKVYDAVSDFGRATSLTLSALRHEPEDFSVAGQPMYTLTMRRRYHKRLEGEDHVLALLREQVERGATDPRDRIYGILDLIDGWHEGQFSVDYNHSPSQVYIRATHSLIPMFKSLDILTTTITRPVQTRLKGLPTWCPDWSNWPISSDLDTVSAEFKDPELDLNYWGNNKFNASPRIACAYKLSDCGMILSVYGVMIDILKDVVDSPFRALKYSRANMEQIIEITKAENDSGRKETLWRTLISSREWDPLTHQYDESAFHSAPTEFSSRFDSWITVQKLVMDSELLKQYESPERPQGAVSEETAAYTAAEISLPADQQPGPGLSAQEISEHSASWILPYRRACKMATANRTFFLTKQDNMGLAPLDARPGDVVVVLYGCSLPVILRPVDGHFEFVGQAYIHGYMTGEATDLAEKGELEQKWFEIH